MIRICYCCLLTILSVFNFAFLWHPYDEGKVYQKECLDNVTAPGELQTKYQWSQWAKKTMSLEFMQKYKLWPSLISKFDLIHGETMFGLE